VTNDLFAIAYVDLRKGRGQGARQRSPRLASLECRVTSQIFARTVIITSSAYKMLMMPRQRNIRLTRGRGSGGLRRDVWLYKAGFSLKVSFFFLPRDVDHRTGLCSRAGSFGPVAGIDEFSVRLNLCDEQDSGGARETSAISDLSQIPTFQYLYEPAGRNLAFNPHDRCSRRVYRSLIPSVT
jgi:hypothetical protein